VLNSPRQYDVQFMTTDELEECLQTQLVQKDVAATVAVTDTNEVDPDEEQVTEEAERGFQTDHE
jgi:hypothetical protein